MAVSLADGKLGSVRMRRGRRRHPFAGLAARALHTTMSKFLAPRATRDFLPPLSKIREMTRTVFTDTAVTYGFQPIHTPAFEHADLFLARSGPEIRRAMLTFHVDHEEFALRPEMTAPVCRLLANGELNELEPPRKLFYVEPCFRYVRANSGGYREFTQAGLESLGPEDPLSDAEMVATALNFIDGTGLAGAHLQIGSVGIFGGLLGDGVDREDQVTVLGHLDLLMGITERGRALEAGDAAAVDLLRMDRRELAALQADTEYAGDYAVANNPDLPAEEYSARVPLEAEHTFRALWAKRSLVAPDVIDRLVAASQLRGSFENVIEHARKLVTGTAAAEAALDRLVAVCELLPAFGVKDFEVVLGIARGFSFYTSTVFEITLGDGPSAKKLGGGGRYDRLVEHFGGPPTPAVGCAFRFDVVVDAIDASDSWEDGNNYDLLFVVADPALLASVVGIAEELRDAGFRLGVERDVSPEFAARAQIVGRVSERGEVMLESAESTLRTPLEFEELLDVLLEQDLDIEEMDEVFGDAREDA